MKLLQTMLVVAALLFSASANAHDQPDTPTREEALKAIADFAQSPASKEGKAAAATIVTFAEDSEDVLVRISPAALPWVGEGKNYKFGPILLAAYVAGNVESQLNSGKKGNDSYAGIQQVMKTYAQLKKTDKTLSIPEIQKFIDLEAKGELKKYLEDALKKEEKASAN